MSTRPDPLLSTGLRPDRLHYATGALLDREDFLAEQSYHRGRLARALLHLHGSGTVAGLRVRVEGAGDEERVSVAEGLAIDRAGRLVEVPRTACLRVGRWLSHLAGSDPGLIGAARVHPGAEDSPVAAQAPGDDDPQAVPPPEGEGDAAEWEAWSGGYLVADVFLRFAACERGKTPAFATGPFDALDAVAPARVRDGYELDMVPRVHPDLLPDPWAGLSAGGAEGRLRLAQRTTMDRRLDPPARPAEYPEGMDATAVLLARLFVPVRAEPGAPAGVARDAAHRVLVNNHLRPFALSGPALGWLARP